MMVDAAGSVTNINHNPIEWAIRVCESIAFCLHCFIGLTESCHGAMRHVTENSIRRLPNDVFFGLAGLVLGTVAVLNFSTNDSIVLGAQCYIMAFHTGAVFTHLRVGHHPVVAAVPGVFVLMAFAVLSIRTDNMVVTMIWTAVSIVAGILLGFVFVKRQEPSTSTTSLQTLLSPNVERFQD